MSSRNALSWFACSAALLAACGAQLPSETPLGRGPLARRSGSTQRPAPAAASAKAPLLPASVATASAAPPSADAGALSKLVEHDAAPPNDSSAPPKAEELRVAFAGAYVGAD